ncbi:MAG: acyl-CoA dehydratase activase [Bacilli bacterium]
MSKYSLGIDVGSISTKGLIIDGNNNIIAEEYIWTEGNPIKATKILIEKLKQQIENKNIHVDYIGVTGSARKIIGVILDASIVKNEITAHAIGTLSLYPDVRTILEIGGQDSKIILIENGIVVDYAMNTLCAAGTGAFLSSQAQRLGIPVEQFGKWAKKSNNPTKIAARCTVFAESDLVHKAQMGYHKEDIIAGLCQAVVTNYLNNVGKGKNIKPSIVFQGGVSKNNGVVEAFKNVLGYEINVPKYSHLMGALGIAIMARKTNNNKLYNLNIENIQFKTNNLECKNCVNHCEVICVYKDDILLDKWGNRCDNCSV